MKVQVREVLLELVEGDITHQDTEAIVNAANSSLLGGGGVDGAIHRAGGPEILAECRKLGGCATGDAKITTGGRLKARHVIHTVGPVYWREGAARAAELLASAYRRSLEVAAEHGLRSVAFPSISTGAYGYPLDEAAPVALQSVIDYLLDQPQSGIELVRFVLYGRQAYEAYQRALASLLDMAAHLLADLGRRTDDRGQCDRRQDLRCSLLWLRLRRRRLRRELVTTEDIARRAAAREADTHCDHEQGCLRRSDVLSRRSSVEVRHDDVPLLSVVFPLLLGSRLTNTAASRATHACSRPLAL